MVSPAPAPSLHLEVELGKGLCAGAALTYDEAMAVLDDVEFRISELPAVDVPVAHNFIPGFYVRTRLVPAGTAIVTKQHRTHHPFHVGEGRCRVWQHGAPAITIEGPFWGMTNPGARRLVLAETELLWTTFHATDLEDPDAIEDEIIEPRVNPLLCHTSPSLAPS